MPISSNNLSQSSLEQSPAISPLAQYVAGKIKTDKFSNPKALALSDVGRFFNDMKNVQLEISVDLYEFKQAKSNSTLDGWISTQKQLVKNFLFGENRHLQRAFDNTNNYYEILTAHLKSNPSIKDATIENAFISAYIIALTYPWMDQIKTIHPINERMLEDYIIITEEEIDEFIIMLDNDNDSSIAKLQEIALDMQNLNTLLNHAGIFSSNSTSSSSSSFACKP